MIHFTASTILLSYIRRVLSNFAEYLVQLPYEEEEVVPEALNGPSRCFSVQMVIRKIIIGKHLLLFLNFHDLL